MGMYFCTGCQTHHDSKDGKDMMDLGDGYTICEDGIRDLLEERQDRLTRTHKDSNA